MKKFPRENFELIVGLQLAIQDADDVRFAHRLHCVLLTLQGMSARKVAYLFDDAPRTVQLWVEKFEHFGIAGLYPEERPGAPPRLSSEQILELDEILRKSPREVGMDANLWDGKTLSAFIQSHFGVTLRVRQCQNLFHQFGFRLRKPRPEIKGSSPESQKAYKKTPKSPRKIGLGFMGR